ncbi:MAG: hypothetical protein ACK4WD_05710 [Flavobacteriales bacterium]|jgi:hypothetical protein
MKKVAKELGQYLNENHDLEKDSEEFLDETAPLIGYIVHFFNSLEQTLDHAICESVSDRTDEPGAIIIHKLSYSAKVDLFYRMIRSMELGFGRDLPSFNTLIQDLRKCGTLRNAVVHADWNHVNEDGFTYVKLDFNKDGLKQHYWQFRAESLMDIIKLISETNHAFDKYEEEKQEMLSS